jgi:DNA-binding MarR family transcriptional regulator
LSATYKCCNLQAIVTRTDDDLRLLAARLDTDWVEIGRFFLSRKLRSTLHHGVAAELSPVQLQAIALLAEEPHRVGALADRLGLAESSATRMVDRLEEQGLTARRVLPADRRSVTVDLTPAGREVAERIAEGRRSYLTGILEALEPLERGELVRLFAKVAAAQRAANEPAAPSARRIS